MPQICNPAGSFCFLTEHLYVFVAPPEDLEDHIRLGLGSILDLGLDKVI